MAKAVLIGNYGQANFGDEALREYFVTRFPSTEWTVLVAGDVTGPAEVPRLPFGLRSLFRPWWKTIGAFRKADVIVFGGGSLFTDIESVSACFLWGWHALVARILGKPYILAAQGIGPFKTAIGEGIARRVVGAAKAVSVRDRESLGRSKPWAKNTEMIQVFDPVFSLIQNKNIAREPQNVFIAIPRLNSGETFFSAVREELSSGKYVSMRIVSLEPHHPAELEVCRKLIELAGSLPCTFVPLLTIAEVLTALACAGKVLSHRYHGALLAVAHGIPLRTVSQAAGDKIDALLKEVENPSELLGRIALLEQQMGPYLGKAA